LTTATLVVVEPAGACARAGETEIDAPINPQINPQINPAARTAALGFTKERMSESNSFESILQPTGYFSIPARPDLLCDIGHRQSGKRSIARLRIFSLRGRSAAFALVFSF
jgi:hypothetical protein